MTDEELKDSTMDFVKRRTYKPMWMRHIPVTDKDYRDKERNWKGFKYALKNIGLDSDVVRRRLITGTTPWDNEEQQVIRSQKAFQEYYTTPPKIPAEIKRKDPYQGTTQPKSKISKPESTP